MSSKSAPPPLSLTTGQLVKMAAPIVLFSILLPAVDNVTDLRMITSLYTGITGCVRSDEIPWQERYICQEDPNAYCERINCVGENLFKRGCDWNGCYHFKLKNEYPENIPGCKYNWNYTYICQEDPVTYCESNPYSDECEIFGRRDDPLWIPGCETCWFNTATFCGQRPDHPTCAYFKHTPFATMFLGM